MIKPAYLPTIAGWFQGAVPRGVALFLGGFSIFNLAGGLFSAGFNANLWWIDSRWLPPPVANIGLLVSSVFLIGFGLRPPRAGWRKAVTLGCVGMLGIITLANAIECLGLLFRGSITTLIPVPLSFLITLIFGLMFIALLRGPDGPASGWSTFGQALVVALGCLIAFPLAEMFWFGKTDYRRSADVAVVFGARVYADGRLSDALADRVRTACQLYRAGLVKRLIFSGGPGDGPITEVEAMKQMAIQSGVKEQDIVEDPAGLNTQATVRNSEEIFSQLHVSRVLAVSHFYHLPRVKMTYKRKGVEVYTVPAKESYVLRQLPYNMAREVVAFWAYFVRPLV